MKNIFKYVAGVLFAGVAMTACSPEDFEGANQNGLPTMAGKDFTMTVDQETNQVQVSFPWTPGVYPVWSFNGANYSTLNSTGWQNNRKGTYKVKLQLANRNGISQDEIEKEFTFNETKASYTSLLNRLNGKEWRIDYAEEAHLACGPLGGDGSGWWSAQPNEKKDFGVYDDRISFESDGVSGGTFTYNPGPDGMTYVNTGTTYWGSEGADFDAPTQKQTATFELKKDDWTDSDGNLNEANFLILSPKTLFPYVSSNKQYDEPRFRIETLTDSKMVLVYENTDGDGISWRFIFTSKAGEIDENDPAYVNWVAVDSPDNLGRDFNTKGEMSFWWADSGWGQIGDPGFSYSNGVYTITATENGGAEWQAQSSIQNIALNIEPGQTYDVSVKLVASAALDRYTFKLCEQSDDDNTLMYNGGLSLDQGENMLQFANIKCQKDGKDSGFSEAKMFFDLGGAPVGFQLQISDIIVQKHISQGGGGFSWVDVNSADNLGKDFNSVGEMEFWWADGGWNQIGNPGFSYSDGVYTITASENGGGEWQAQNSIHHVAMNIEPGQAYAVRATIEASAAVGRYTFKICDEGDDDNTLLYNGGLSLEQGENTVEFRGLKCQKDGVDTGFSEAKLFIDLGGIEPGTVIKLSNIIIQKDVETAPTPGGDDSALSYDSSDNLWKAVDEGSMFDAYGYYFVTGDGWSPIDYTEVEKDGNAYTLTLPADLGTLQWQGQFHIDTKLTASGSKKYDFQVEMEATDDCPQVTFKLTDDGDANYFFEERQNVPGGEKFVLTRKGVTLKNGTDAAAIRLFFDFGGSPAGTKVTISRIVFQEAK